MHVRDPYDLCVYELDNTPAHQFIWPYLFHYPGVLWLRTDTVHDSRAEALEREGRVHDYLEEFTFNHGLPLPTLSAMRGRIGRNDWPMVRAPMIASKLVVVPHNVMRASFQLEYPDVRVRHVPSGTPEPIATSPLDTRAGITSASVISSSSGARLPAVFGVVGRRSNEAIEGALERAREAGVRADLVNGEPEAVIQQSEVVLALDWPPAGRALTGALAGMAAAKTVVVFESEVTADWPSLDPQSWRPRGGDSSLPIVVSIDPRDEEHSLVLTMRRLASDGRLREQLASAGHAWWRDNATISHARQGWNSVLEDAVSMTPPPRPANWPRHLTADGTELAREILAEFGRTLDLNTKITKRTKGAKR
jgi:hypothetical protein